MTNVSPKSDINAPIGAPIGQPIEFDGQLSSDIDGAVRSWHWVLGDGHVSRSPNFDHVYQDPGSYNVLLTVFDRCGFRDESTHSIEIVDPATYVAPSTDFLVNPDSPLASEVVTFSASATPNKVLSYTWHFGDGTTLNNAARTVQHLYTQSGVYDVTLEIVGFDNRVYSTHRSLSIPEEETGPLAARFNAYELVSMVPAVNPATSEQQIGADGEPVWDEQWREIDLANEQIELGLRIKFDASESTGAANFIWGFGGMGESAQYAFSEPGTYQVRLDAYNATWTELDTVTTTIHVVNRMDLVDVMSSVNRDASDMAIDGNIAWVTRRTDELVAIDISNPSNLVRVDSFSAPSGWRVAAGQGRVYVARGSFGLDVHSQAISPGSRSVTTFDTFAADGQYVTDVVADGNLVYIAAGPVGLRVLNVANPQNPRLVASASLPPGAQARWLEVKNGLVFVCDQNTGIYTIDVSGIGESTTGHTSLPVASTNSATWPVDQLQVSESGVLAARSVLGVEFFLVGSAGALEYAGSIDPEVLEGRTPGSVVFRGNTLLLGIANKGASFFSLWRFDLTDPTSPYLMSTLDRNGEVAGGLLPAVAVGNHVFWGSEVHDLFSVVLD